MTQPSTTPLRTVARGSVALLVPLVLIAIVGSQVASNSALRLITNMFITVGIVVGLQIFAGNSGIISWGHMAFVAAGAYVTAWLTVPSAIKKSIFASLPDWLAQMTLGYLPTVMLATAAGVVVALIVGAAIIRMKEGAMAMATLGLLVIAHGILVNLVGWTAGALGVYGLPSNTTLWITLAFAGLVVVVALGFKSSRLGLRLRASREDPLAADAVGVNIVNVRLWSWLLSAAVSAAAGSIWAQYNLAFGPSQFYFTQLFATLCMLVIGGISTVSGAVVGVVLVTIVSEALRNLEQGTSISGLQQMALAIIMLVVLILRPDGLLGWKELDVWVEGWLAKRGFGRARAELTADDGGG